MKKLLIILLLTSSAFAKCGTERWSVKTLTDTTSSLINWTAKSATVEELIKLKSPAHRAADKRVFGIETQLWEIHVLWLGYKYEADGDFHLVLASPLNEKLTFIGEVPSYECANPKYAQTFIKIRSMILESGKPHKTGQMLWFDEPKAMLAQGVGFFDFLHHQNGVAENGIELHPLIKFEVDTKPPKSPIRHADAETIWLYFGAV